MTGTNGRMGRMGRMRRRGKIGAAHLFAHVMLYQGRAANRTRHRNACASG